MRARWDHICRQDPANTPLPVATCSNENTCTPVRFPMGILRSPREGSRSSIDLAQLDICYAASGQHPAANESIATHPWSFYFRPPARTCRSTLTTAVTCITRVGMDQGPMIAYDTCGNRFYSSLVLLLNASGANTCMLQIIIPLGCKLSVMK